MTRWFKGWFGKIALTTAEIPQTVDTYVCDRCGTEAEQPIERLITSYAPCPMCLAVFLKNFGVGNLQLQTLELREEEPSNE